MRDMRDDIYMRDIRDEIREDMRDMREDMGEDMGEDMVDMGDVREMRDGISVFL